MEKILKMEELDLSVIRDSLLKDEDFQLFMKVERGRVIYNKLRELE